MKTVGCACGYRAEGRDLAELRAQIRAHVRSAHSELVFTEEQIRDWAAAGSAAVRVARRPTGKEVMPVTGNRGRERTE